MIIAPETKFEINQYWINLALMDFLWNKMKRVITIGVINK
jgi:hypothetical protein